MYVYVYHIVGLLFIFISFYYNCCSTKILIKASSNFYLFLFCRVFFFLLFRSYDFGLLFNFKIVGNSRTCEFSSDLPFYVREFKIDIFKCVCVCVEGGGGGALCRVCSCFYYKLSVRLLVQFRFYINFIGHLCLFFVC